MAPENTASPVEPADEKQEVVQPEETALVSPAEENTGQSPVVEEETPARPTSAVEEKTAPDSPLPGESKTPEIIDIPPQYIAPSNTRYHIPNPLGQALKSPVYDPKWLERLITDEAMQVAWQQTIDLEKEVKCDIPRAEIAESLLTMLMQARRHLLSGKTQYDEANSLLHSVAYSVNFYRQAQEDTKKYAWWLFLYESLWLVGMLVLTMWILRLNSLPSSAPNINTAMREFLGAISADQLLKSLVWGSLGGIAGAMHALWRHAAKLHDFSKRYNLWYITMPILGLGLGGFIYLIFQAGFFSLVGGTQSGIDIKSPFMIYLVAWAVGFKQNVVYNLVQRVIDVIYPPAYEKSEDENI